MPRHAIPLIVLSALLAPAGVAAAQGVPEDSTPPAFQPTGWTWIGYDTDNDQQVDTYEYINTEDLRQARQLSQERMRLGQGPADRLAPQPPPGIVTPPETDLPATRRPIHRTMTFSGVLRDIETFSIDGQLHTVAKLDLGSNRILRVDLGPASQIDPLGLVEGRRITVTGHRGMIDERQTLIAHRVVADGQVAQVRPAMVGREVRVRGTVLSTREAMVRGQEHIQARVELDSGQIVIVDLGRATSLRRSWIEPGQNVLVLARRARLGDRPVLLATRIYADNRQYPLVQEPIGPRARRPAQTFAMVEPGQPRLVRQVRLTGEIRDIRTFSINDRQHTLVKVETPTGQLVPVDLGPSVEVRELDVRRGKLITVWGHRDLMDGRSTLVAHRVQAGDRQVIIQPTMEDRQVRLEGQIESVRRARLLGQDHLLVGVRLGSDRVVQVDLGRAAVAEKARLQAGDRVRVLAHPVTIGNRGILQATRLYANRQQYRLEQPAMQP